MTEIRQKEPLRRAIGEAFADVPYPGDDAITLYPTDHRGEKTQQDFKGRHWRDLPPEAVSRCWVMFLRPEARQFYLPAFLLEAIDRLPKGYDPTDFFDLVPPEDIRRFRREYDGYSSAQKGAIRLFLEYARDNAKTKRVVALARLALERYWGEEANRPPGDVPGATGEMTQQEEIKQRIRVAFADTPYPGDDAISRVHCYEEEEIRQHFKGYHWSEVPRSILCYHFGDMSLFNKEGLRFFLPAYLLAAFDCDDNIIDFTVYHLDPADDDPEMVAWSKTRFAVFRPAERQAIRLFLEYVRDETEYEDLQEHARRALEQYWALDA